MMPNRTTNVFPLKTLAAYGVCWLVLSSAAVAQVQVEKRRAAANNGYVHVENSFGSVVVRGWDQAEVLVKARLAPGAQGLDLDGDKGTYIEVEEPEHWFYAPGDDSDFQSDLEVFVPLGSKVDVETVNAGVEVYAVRGHVLVDTVNGSVLIDTKSSHVDAETMTGDITVKTVGAQMSIESISGTVSLTGVAREVEVATVSGPISISGKNVASLSVETVTGSVDFRGSLAQRGEIDVETFSGSVLLILPDTVKAEFEIETFGGQITSDIGPKVPVTRRFEPYRTLSFSTGFDEYEVEVTTHEGNVELRVAEDPWAP